MVYGVKSINHHRQHQKVSKRSYENSRVSQETIRKLQENTPKVSKNIGNDSKWTSPCQWLLCFTQLAWPPEERRWPMTPKFHPQVTPKPLGHLWCASVHISAQVFPHIKAPDQIEAPSSFSSLQDLPKHRTTGSFLWYTYHLKIS